jgi:hypothetical protein
MKKSRRTVSSLAFPKAPTAVQLAAVRGGATLYTSYTGSVAPCGLTTQVNPCGLSSTLNPCGLKLYKL